MYKTFVTEIVVALCLTGFVIAQEQNQRSPTAEPVRLDSPEAAYLRALEYTGFARAIDTAAIDFEDIVEKTIVTGGNNPCAHPELEGREVWQVTFDTVRLYLASCSYDAILNQTPKTYEVLLDPETGRLYHIRSVPCADGSPERDPALEPSRRIAHRVSLYHDLLPAPPDIDFYAAMGNAREANPLLAEQIVGVAVRWSDIRRDKRPAWVVIGIRQEPDLSDRPQGRQVPSLGLRGTNSWESVVDATSGKGLCSTGLPPRVESKSK